MDPELKEEINELAELFYKSDGYRVSAGFDFSESNHPQEIGHWNKALIAYCFFNDEFELLDYQV